MDFMDLYFALGRFEGCEIRHYESVMEFSLSPEGAKVPRESEVELWLRLADRYVQNACSAEAEQAYGKVLRLSHDLVNIQKAQAGLQRVALLRQTKAGG